MRILSRYSIKIRLTISVILGFVGMLLITTQSLMQTNNNLLSEKKQQIQYLVESAHSLINSQYDAFQTNKLTEKQAKENAISIINAIRYDNGNYFWINDKQSIIIDHPIKPSLNGKDLSALKDANGKNIFPAFIKKAKEQPEGGIVGYLWPKPGSKDPIDKISFVKEFKAWGWIIGTGVYINDLDASMWESIKTLLINLVIITLLILTLSFFIAKSIITPIKVATDALADLAQDEGDLTQRLPVEGQDEIAKLSLSFNTFIIKIQNIIGKVQDSTKAMESSSNDLSSLSQKSLESGKQQNEETTQIAISSSDMLNTINDIANNATTAAKLAKGAMNEAQIGQCIVADSVQSVQRISDEINAVSAVISDLNTECSAIDSVLSVIEAIAEQTNLLALNAAIEAARAGEQGRGFAVVADEVRTLAGRTQKATLEINGMIAQLQDKATQAVSVIQNSESTAENAVQQANKTSESLDAISNTITAISDVNHHIASAADEQSTVTSEIEKRVTEIANLSKESTKRSVKINNGSDDVSQLGIQLRELIKTFHI